MDDSFVNLVEYNAGYARRLCIDNLELLNQHHLTSVTQYTCTTPHYSTVARLHTRTRPVGVLFEQTLLIQWSWAVHKWSELWSESCEHLNKMHNHRREHWEERQTAQWQQLEGEWKLLIEHCFHSFGQKPNMQFSANNFQLPNKYRWNLNYSYKSKSRAARYFLVCLLRARAHTHTRDL